MINCPVTGMLVEETAKIDDTTRFRLPNGSRYKVSGCILQQMENGRTPTSSEVTNVKSLMNVAWSNGKIPCIVTDTKIVEHRTITGFDVREDTA